MSNSGRNFFPKDLYTGGRGTEEIRNLVYSLLDRYAIHTGSLTPPIDPSVLAELQNAKIIYRCASKHWVASLMPMGNGFIINVNESFPENRKRNAICHEIAHTFFFDTASGFPRRIKNSRPDSYEERLCFWAAREMLVPFPLLKSELDTLGREKIYFFEGVIKLSKIFIVSPDIIAYRLTHDLALLGNDWIILWYSNSQIGAKSQPVSLYPKHISIHISNYLKKKIIEAIYNTLMSCGGRGRSVEMEHKVGERKNFRFKVRTEQVDREKLHAISWVSPL